MGTLGLSGSRALRQTPKHGVTKVRTYRADIFIAGDRAAATLALRRFCLQGLCVSVSDCDFIYTGGAERGLRIGLINYPRFPATRKAIREQALNLATVLLGELCQRSCSVVCDDKTIWLSNESVGGR